VLAATSALVAAATNAAPEPIVSWT
jgi:hypothetical protein